MTRVLALTGGIGTGKSSVARMFEKLGAVIVDADAVVHELQAAGAPLLAEIAAAFGPETLRGDGSLDREALGARVFSDAAARARLNAIVHPKVGAEMARRTEAAQRTGAPLVLLDIPLLFETGGAGRGARGVILVYARRDQQIERQLARGGVDAAQAEARVRAQLPIDDKRTLADFVIDNSGSVAETERQVRELWPRLVGD